MAKRQKLEQVVELPPKAAIAILTTMELATADLKLLYQLLSDLDRTYLFLRLVLAIVPKDLVQDDRFWRNVVANEYPEEFQLFEGNIPRIFIASNFPVKNAPWMRFCYWINANYHAILHRNWRGGMGLLLQHDGQSMYPPPTRNNRNVLYRNLNHLGLSYVRFMYDWEGVLTGQSTPDIEQFRTFIAYRTDFDSYAAYKEKEKDIVQGNNLRSMYRIFADLPRSEDFPYPVIACTVCGEKVTGKCQRCEKALYCGKACQIKDWENHKMTCLS